MINASQVNPNYFYPDRYKDAAEKFFNEYKIVLEVGSTDRKPSLKNRQSRICRFCNGKLPKVSFKKDAHAISELLGNKNYLCDYECDTCNLIFSKYEDNLANFLGIVRTVQSVKGKRVPKFKSADQKVDSKSFPEDDITNRIEFRRYDGLNKTFQFDKKSCRAIITYTKASYIPLKVFKAFLKMALSVMPSEYVKEFSFCKEYLLKDDYDENFSGFAIVHRYNLPLNFSFGSPTAMVFKKKQREAPLFSYVFVLFAMNSIFQIVLPFCDMDRWLYRPKSPIKMLWCPPLFGNDNSFNIDERSHDLNSLIKIIGEKESIEIPTSAIELERSVITRADGSSYKRIFDGDKIIGIDLLMQEINSNTQSDT